MRYLAIKNWDKYQSAKANCTWVKDYVEKDFDPEFAKLTLSQKGMLDACCRLRARRGSNLTNDPLWICSAVAIKAQERHNAVTAIRQLMDSGFLVLTNEQHSSLDKSREDKNRGDKEEDKNISEAPAKQPRKPKAACPETSSGLKAVLLLPLNNGDEYPIAEEDFGLWKQSYPAVDVMQELRAMAAWCHSNPTRRKTKTGVKAFVNRWLAKAQNNPKAAQSFKEGSNGQTSKSQQRHERNNAKYARLLGVLPEGAGGDLSLGDAGGGIGIVPRFTEQIPAGGSEAGGTVINALPPGRMERNTEIAGLHTPDTRAKGATSGGN